MKKAKCPNCGSTSMWVRVSILAKKKYNGEKVYDVDLHNQDNYFGGDCGCDKCGWEGTEDEFVY